jgi:hypothetical protein
VAESKPGQHGGARKRSGPPPDPTSGATERGRNSTAKIDVRALPAGGYTGRPPGLNQFVGKPTARHRAVWAQLWKTPQAAAWSLEPWRWRMIADLARAEVRNEDFDAPAHVFKTVSKLRDELGLSDAGMRYLGWKIALPNVDLTGSTPTGRPPASTRQAALEGEAAPRRQRRLRVAPDAEAAAS